jgi:hypothetical protein
MHGISFDTMMKRRPKRLAQSLLSFPANASPARRDDISLTTLGANVDADSTGKPPPTLPPELWHMILSSLGNTMIKKFRLVHPQWASIGARYLFQTVYLSVHPHSVAGLIQIAESTHAILVTNIVWSSLALWPDCLEAGIWRSTYKHLLGNIKHPELVELHQIYHRLFRDQTQKRPDDQISNLGTALGKLVNCRELNIDDGLKDMESACCDPEFRSAVQRSSPFNRASIWVSTPRLDFSADRSIFKLVVESCVEIIGALPHCPTLLTVRVNCQEWFWDSVMASVVSLRDRRSQSQSRGYRSVFISVRALCIFLERPIDCHGQVASFSVSFEYLGSFELPELVDLILKIVPVRERDRTQMSVYGPASSHSHSDSKSTSSTSDLSEEHDGLVSDTLQSDDGPVLDDKFNSIEQCHRFVEETRLILGLVRFPKLRKLTVGNVLIDTDLLLAWCWFQPHLPHSRLTIAMENVVILDQLALEDFASALASLNVELMYDHRFTGYFDRSEWSHKLSIKKRWLFVDSKRFDDLQSWDNYISIQRTLELMPPMADVSKFQTKELVVSNRTDFLRGDSPRWYFSWNSQALEDDPEYMLDFWEEAQDSVACAMERSSKK